MLIKSFGFFIPFIFFLSSVSAQQINAEFKTKILSYPEIKAFAYQPDGKIIIAGNVVQVGSSIVRGIARLNADGTHDPSFIPPPDIFGYDSYVYSIVVDQAGKILLAGYFGSTKITCIRLNTDGTQDNTFQFQEALVVYKIAAMLNGKYLVLCGPLQGNPLIVLNNNGSIYPSFNAGPGPDGWGAEDDIAVQADGKVLFGGHFTQFSGHPAGGLIRLLTNGTIDPTFSITPGFKGNNPTVQSIAVQPDGRVVVAGRFNTYNNVDAVDIVRLMPDGNVDPGFILPGPTANILSLGVNELVLFDNGIVVAGIRQNINGTLDYTGIKLKMDGSLDTGFNMPTFERLIDRPFLGPFMFATANNLFYSAAFSKSGDQDRPGITMLTKSGSVDASFAPTIRGTADVKTLQVQSDDKIIVGGTFDFVGDTKVRNLARLNPDGTLDNAFVSNLGTGPESHVTMIRIDDNGKILVGGAFSKFNAVSTGQLLRLNTDGTRDQSFNSNILLSYADKGPTVVELVAGNKVLVGGIFSTVNGTPINNLVRLNSDGATDLTFNTQLLTTEQFVTSATKLSNGDFVIAGSMAFNGGGWLRKTDANGVIKKNFSEVDLSNTTFYVVKALEDEKFIGIGNFSYLFPQDAPTPMFQFDKNGNVTDKLSVGISQGGASGISFISADEFILTGTFRKINNVKASGFARVKLNGTVSQSYSYQFGGFPGAIVKTDVNKNKFIIGGYFSAIEGDSYFSVAKLNLDIPSSPASLASTKDDTFGKITLSWTDRSINETAFEVFRSVDGAYSSLAKVNANVTGMVDSTASPQKKMCIATTSRAERVTFMI